MKKLIFFLFLMPAAYSQNCTYFMKKTEVMFWEYPINFEQALIEILENKGYSQVLNSTEADFQLDIELTQMSMQHFKHAKAEIIFEAQNPHFKSQKIVRTKRCLMMNCSVYDAIKTLKMAIKKFNPKVCD